MAVLSNADRAAVHALWMHANTDVTGAMTKAELRLAVNAIDDWVDQNAASLNSAIPQPARGALSARQKAWLLSFVVRKRFDIL
jgi:hypothetical protein